MLVQQLVGTFFDNSNVQFSKLLSVRPDRLVVQLQAGAKTLILKVSKNSRKISNEWNAERHLSASGLTCEPQCNIVRHEEWLGYWCIAGDGQALSCYEGLCNIRSRQLNRLGRSLAPLYALPHPPIDSDYADGECAQQKILERRIRRWSLDCTSNYLSSNLSSKGLSLVGRLANIGIQYPICFLHGDLIPKNLLMTPSRVVAIDFEHCHFGHPLFDLAKLCDKLRLSPEEREVLVRGALNETLPSNFSELLDFFSEVHRFGVAIWCAGHGVSDAC